MIAVVVGLLLLCASSVRADVVTLKDGTVYEGKVAQEDGSRVVIEVVISNIKTTKTFPRYKVRSVEYKPLEVEEEKPTENEGEKKTTPRDTPEPEKVGMKAPEDAGEDKAPSRARPRSRLNRELFVVIPVRGMIGMETNAAGLRNALSQSRKRGVQHVVFSIDSGGGYLYDALEALEVIKEYDDTFTFHALIEEGAISAASIYVAASDHIWVRPGSRVGGAVAYSNNTSSGAAEVDAKLNSIWAAELASHAHLKGHSPDVFRAMVEPAAELWTDDEGKTYPSRPTTPGAQQLDNATSVLTIRADQMLRIGMVKELNGDIEGIAEILESEKDWFEVRTIGKKAMDRAHETRKKLNDRYEHAVEVFVKALDEFESVHTQQFDDYEYYRGSNGKYYIEGFSFQRWRERSDLAIRQCDIMLEALGVMAKVNKTAADIGAVHLEYLPDEYGHDAYVEIKDARSSLYANRAVPPSR